MAFVVRVQQVRRGLGPGLAGLHSKDYCAAAGFGAVRWRVLR